jgi:hypothetical protein
MIQIVPTNGPMADKELSDKRALFLLWLTSSGTEKSHD